MKNNQLWRIVVSFITNNEMSEDSFIEYLDARYSIEIKLDSIEKKQLAFKETIRPYLDTYGKEMCIEFYSYWCEPNKTRKKIRWELEKTWDVKLRLERWSKNNKKFSQKKGNNKPTPQDYITIAQMAKDGISND